MGVGGFDPPEPVPPNRNPTPQSKLRGDAPDRHRQYLHSTQTVHRQQVVDSKSDYLCTSLLQAVCQLAVQQAVRTRHDNEHREKGNQPGQLALQCLSTRCSSAARPSSPRPVQEHRPLGNTDHPDITKSIQLLDITECSQVALYHQNPIWKVNLSMHC